MVKAFAREEYEIEKFDRANTDYAETNKATGMVWLKFFPFVESIANLMPVVLLAVGGVFMIKIPDDDGRLRSIFRYHLGNRKPDASDGKYHERVPAVLSGFEKSYGTVLLRGED